MDQHFSFNFTPNLPKKTPNNPLFTCSPCLTVEMICGVRVMFQRDKNHSSAWSTSGGQYMNCVGPIRHCPSTCCLSVSFT